MSFALSFYILVSLFANYSNFKGNLIYIYYTYLSEENHANLLNNELSKFSIDFIAKIKKQKRWQDAQLSLLGRILLFKGIREQYHLNIEEKEVYYNAFNKPFFKENPVHFSISHSGEIAICAISDDTQIGIDIEKISEININTFKPYMLDTEWKRIKKSINKYEAFFEYWTQKEAIIKALGFGQINLKSFEIIDNSTLIVENRFYLKEVKIDQEYKCSISYNRQSDYKDNEGFIYLYKIIL